MASTAGSRASSMVLSPGDVRPRLAMEAAPARKNSTSSRASIWVRSRTPSCPAMNMVPKMTPDAPPMVLTRAMPASRIRAKISGYLVVFRVSCKTEKPSRIPVPWSPSPMMESIWVSRGSLAIMTWLAWINACCNCSTVKACIIRLAPPFLHPRTPPWSAAQGIRRDSRFAGCR